jgi:hypothetical protein
MLTLPLINQRQTLTPLEDTQDRMEIMITMMMLFGEVNNTDNDPLAIETLTIASAAVNSPAEA